MIFTFIILFVAVFFAIDVFSILKVYGFPTKSHAAAEEALDGRELYRNSRKSVFDDGILHYFGQKNLRYISAEHHTFGIPFYHISENNANYIVLPWTRLYKKIDQKWDDQPEIPRRYA